MNIRPLIFRFCLLLIVLLAGCHAAHNPHIASAVSEVNEVYLRAHIDKLTAIGSRFARRDESGAALYVSNKTAQKQKLAYLARCFKDYGYRVWQPGFDVSGLRGGRGINLIAFKEGTTQRHRVLELGAHYDTIANPGADDNCSGVAGVLEAARVLAKIPTERSIRFCLYDLEEVGLLGSREHVKLLQDKADFLARDEIFDGAIVLETIGYAVAEKDTQHSPIRIPLIADPPRTGNFILVVGNFKSAHLGRDFEWAARTYADNLPYYSLNCLGGFFKDAARSDHSSYWQAGLPAVMITDTANFRNPHYHRTSDTPETLNFTFLSRVVQATVGTLLNYAQPVDNDG